MPIVGCFAGRCRQNKEAPVHFVGKHDFAAFANMRPKPRWDLDADTVRTITCFDIADTDQGVCLEIEGTLFLYRQVRNMVGLLVEVGRGQYEPSIVSKLIALKNRQLAPISALAHGLVLEAFAYHEELMRPPLDSSAGSFGRLVRKPPRPSRLDAQLAAIL
jgi:tRNA pseudouridine38-40 synthase